MVVFYVLLLVAPGGKLAVVHELVFVVTSNELELVHAMPVTELETLVTLVYEAEATSLGVAERWPVSVVLRCSGVDEVTEKISEVERLLGRSSPKLVEKPIPCRM